jgi:hypothetical protein
MQKECTRREALRTVGASMVIVAVPGCGAAIQTIQQVLVRVPWNKVLAIISSVLTVTNRSLSIAAKLDGEEKETLFESTLVEADARQLINGARLLIRTEDGKEFDVTPAIK